MNWTCPYCQRAQVVVDSQFFKATRGIQIDNVQPTPMGYRLAAIACANAECRRLTITLTLFPAAYSQRHGYIVDDESDPIHVVPILPESAAKPQPAYIPNPIVSDYTEACRIKALSPEASATLSRRCLQGMIRDFAGVEERSLYQEIETLKRMADKGDAPKGVTTDSIDALHGIRSIGNIGAHMEKDINTIIDVAEDEAGLMIELVETLLEEWYVARHKREKRMADLMNAAAAKTQIKAVGRD